MRHKKKRDIVHLAPGEKGKSDISGYERLANAIVMQACRDYYDAVASGAAWDVTALELFFRSDWYCLLTKLDGEWLMEEIRRKSIEKTKRGFVSL